jgi:hypothetical protein
VSPQSSTCSALNFLNRSGDIDSHDNVRRYVLGTAAVCLFSYVAVRAWRLSLTFDEAETFLSYIRAPLLSVFNVATANNHLLNTWLVRLCAAVGGSGEFVLRLPNLLSYAFYLWFSIKIVRTYIPRAFLIPAFLLLNLNPYLLDFFSLCRGYGLSLGLLLGSLFYFLEFLRPRPEPFPGRTRLLAKSLGLCAFAVLANFSVLNVFLGLVAWALVIMFLENKSSRPTAPPAPDEDVPKKRRMLLAGLLFGAALVFNGVMTVQAVLVRPDLKKPVTLGLVGLDPVEKKAVMVYGIDLGKLEVPFLWDGESWKNERPLAFSGIKIKIPAASWNKVRSIDILLGTRLFSTEYADLQAWPMERVTGDVVLKSPPSLSLARSRLPVLREVINWDGLSVAGICGRTALAAALIACAVLVVSAGLFHLLIRLRLYRRGQIFPVFAVSLSLAAFIAFPLTILKTAGELYYGASTGFIHDTVFSLINDSLYSGFLGLREQTILLLLILGSFVTGLFVFLRPLRSNRDDSGSLSRAGLTLIAVLHLAALSMILQHALLNNPYLIGRTALFIIPLYMVFLILLLAGLKRIGRGGSAIAAVLFVGLAAIAVFHFGRSANFVLVKDWRRDADTKAMVLDIAIWKTRHAPNRPVLNLGIQWEDIATTEYYRLRYNFAWLIPCLEDERTRYENADMYYLASGPNDTEARLANLGLRALKKFPMSEHALLVRIK